MPKKWTPLAIVIALSAGLVAANTPWTWGGEPKQPYHFYYIEFLPGFHSAPFYDKSQLLLFAFLIWFVVYMVVVGSVTLLLLKVRKARKGANKL